MVGTSSKEGGIMMSTIDKGSKVTPGIDSKENAHQPSGLKDDANEVAVDIEKEYDVSEATGEAPLKA